MIQWQLIENISEDLPVSFWSTDTHSLLSQLPPKLYPNTNLQVICQPLSIRKHKYFVQLSTINEDKLQSNTSIPEKLRLIICHKLIKETYNEPTYWIHK